MLKCPPSPLGTEIFILPAAWSTTGVSPFQKLPSPEDSHCAQVTPSLREHTFITKGVCDPLASTQDNSWGAITAPWRVDPGFEEPWWQAIITLCADPAPFSPPQVIQRADSNRVLHPSIHVRACNQEDLPQVPPVNEDTAYLRLLDTLRKWF